MRRRKGIFAFSLLSVALFFTQACGKKFNYVLPTLAPTYTPTPKVDEGPTPTPAPDANNTKIISLNGEEFNQTTYFTARGDSKLSLKPFAYSGAYSFYVEKRNDTYHGVSLNFSDEGKNVVNVIGKTVHVAAWVYHESAEPQDFSFTLSVRKMDGTTDTPESVSISGVPSGQWALLEGDIPVYSNIKSPTVSIEMSSSKDPFYFDDIRVTYDPSSAVGANAAYTTTTFNGMNFDFEDRQAHLRGRGSANVAVVGDGFGGSGSCLYVTGRTANWNGAEIDLSEYGLGGSKIWISYAAKHEASQKTNVKCSLQYRIAGTTSDKYASVTTTESLLPGTWGEASASITIAEGAESVIVYFETGATENFYIDNVIITATDPSQQQGQNPSGGGSEEDPLANVDLSKFVVIHSLTGDSGANETQIFENRGSASASIVSNGHTGNGFLVSGRNATWNGVGLHFENLANESFDVIGKQVYLSAWVYQNSGEPVEFSATIQVLKPDGNAAWPERAAINVLPSGQWMHVEGILPVYANVKAPQINFELPNSEDADFILDDIIISYDPTSSVDPNPDYVIAEKLQFTTISLDFEDNNAYFQGRGNGQPSIVGGGHAGGKCLAVTGRTSSWHGVQADLTDYDLAGKTLDITYWVSHDYTTPLEINMTAEQNDGENTTYTPVVVGEPIEDGKWVKYNTTYTVPEDALRFMLYFESPSTTAEFYVDDVLIKLQ
ncbi:MAG: carbohydrate binding domain-containing protein [Lachnospiraceae bacterium]|nr:carbohydrate binding domain-containing protein [Lachnospiraceae bacterium]